MPKGMKGRTTQIAWAHFGHVRLVIGLIPPFFDLICRTNEPDPARSCMRATPSLARPRIEYCIRFESEDPAMSSQVMPITSCQDLPSRIELACLDPWVFLPIDRRPSLSGEAVAVAQLLADRGGRAIGWIFQDLDLA